MTKEEAIKSALKFLVRKQQEQGSWGYSDNDDTHEVSWNEIIEWVDARTMAIKALEQTSALDKARAEIEQLETYDRYTGESYLACEFREDVLYIIDKYKAESEDKEWQN